MAEEKQKHSGGGAGGGIVAVDPKPNNGLTSKVIDFVEKLIVKLMYDSSLPHHYLSGNFAPVREETPPTTDLLVKGHLPDCLNGEFVRVGPNPRFSPVAGYHWFDGDGVCLFVQWNMTNFNISKSSNLARNFNISKSSNLAILARFNSGWHMGLSNYQMILSNWKMLQMNTSSIYCAIFWTKDITNLVSLRHLDDWACYKLRLPQGLWKLTGLQSLPLFIARNNCGLGELNGLNNLRGTLEIEILEQLEDAILDCKVKSLREKQHLEKLKLTWAHQEGHDEMLLDSL